MKGISLFASGGIGEYFLHETKVKMVLANELIEKRCEFFRTMYPDKEMIQGSIADPDVFAKIIKECKKQKIDFVIATPPCQGMSKAGKMSFDDPRNSLFLHIIDLVKEIRPKYVLIENVPEFKTCVYRTEDGKHRKIMDKITDELGQEYHIECKILNTQDFSVPQSRKRAIVLLSRLDQKMWQFPKPHDEILTVRDTISHLPSLKNGQRLTKGELKEFKAHERDNIARWHFAKKHNDRHTLWMKHTPSGKSAFDNEKDEHKPNINGRIIKGFRTTYKRIGWDKPAPTITMANGSVSSQNNVHPGRRLSEGVYSDPRVLSVYELLLLTSFPKDVVIPDDTSERLIRDLLGECVPPRFMHSLVSVL